MLYLNDFTTTQSIIQKCKIVIACESVLDDSLIWEGG